MCMEDIRLGRKKFSRVETVAVNGAGQFTVPNDPSRVSVLFPSGEGVDIRISDKPIAAATQGIEISSALAPMPFRLTVEEFGDFVTNAIHGRWLGGPNISYLTTSLSER